MSIIWGSATKTSLKLVERNLRFSARKILGKKKFDPIKFEIYETLNWLLPSDSYAYSALCFIFHNTVNKRFPYFQNLIKYRHEIHSHQTRNKNELHICTAPRSEYGKKSLVFKACNLWNQLPIEITNSETIYGFKSKLKMCLLNKGKANSV